MSNKNYWNRVLLLLFLVFDEAALTDDLLVQLVEALKKHKESINKQKESETAKEKEKQTSEGRLSLYYLLNLAGFYVLSINYVFSLEILSFSYKVLKISAERSSKDEGKPAEEAEKHDELFDAIASLFPDKGLLGAEVYRR